MKEKFNFFAVVNGRMRRLLEKIGLPDATKEVNFAHETLDDLAAGRLVRGSLFADQNGEFYFHPYAVGEGKKLGPRRPKTADTPAAAPAPVINLHITLQVAIGEQGLMPAHADELPQLLASLFNLLKGGAPCQ